MQAKQLGLPTLLGKKGVVSVMTLLTRFATSSSTQAMRMACWSGRGSALRLEDEWKALNLCFNRLKEPRLASKLSLSGLRARMGFAP